MSTHNIGFYEDFTKNIFHLSSNTHHISSSVYVITIYTHHNWAIELPCGNKLSFHILGGALA